MKGLRLRIKAETQLAAGLRQQRHGQEQKNRCPQESFQMRTSDLFKRVWKQLTTTIKTISGKNCHGCGRSTTTFCSSPSKLPSEGSGSVTPSPNAPKFASVMMNTGTEIQNCANSVPRRLGIR